MKRVPKGLLIVIAILVVGLIATGVALANPPKQGPTQGDVPIPNQPPLRSGDAPAIQQPPTGQPNQVDDQGLSGAGIDTIMPYGQFNYQGQLQQDGVPFDGTIVITFSLYYTDTGDTAWWQEAHDVTVQDGLFNVLLGSVNPIDRDTNKFYNQMWLGVQPDGAAELSPRQLLGTVAHAMNVMPGATMVDESPSGPYWSAFFVRTDNHIGIYGASGVGPGIYGVSYYTGSAAVYGSSNAYEGYGIEGMASAPTGIGVYGLHASGDGILPGVYGETSSDDWFANAVVGEVTSEAAGLMSAGVRGINQSLTGFGVGVWGSHDGAGWGVHGSADGGMGVYGTSTTGKGISGYVSGDDSYGLYGANSGDSTSCPPGATACAAGVYGTASGDSYASFFYGDSRASIIAVNDDDHSQYTIWAYTQDAPDGFGLWTNGESRFTDYVTFDGGKSGYVIDIALNDGTVPLEKGDIVVISGYDDAVVGNIPVIRVQKANELNATGVVGVVDVLYVPCTVPFESLEMGQSCGGYETSVTTIQPGEYLGIVTLGAYEAIKVDASFGPIQPGDLLAASPNTGYALKATPLTVEGVSFYAPGTIIGKALGSLDKGMGLIPVFVSAR